MIKPNKENRYRDFKISNVQIFAVFDKNFETRLNNKKILSETIIMRDNRIYVDFDDIDDNGGEREI